MARQSVQVKTQVKAWAEAAGLWEEFVVLRESLKRKGLSANDAWLRAAQMLAPDRWGEPPVEEQEERVVAVEEPSPPADLPRVRGGGDGAPAEVFGGKKVATVRVVEWVASNLQVSDVGPGDAPSSEAWGMLVWARRSPVNESQFWGQIYAKLLPSRSQIEAEQRYSEDGVRVEDLAGRLLMIREGLEQQPEAN